ncbi:MAG: YceI family protein [Xanthomonadaceae bacterium]|nr:YceI family protein [Xanthomonadaceae bacterium]MDP2184689.1 YceI family protein [Xanthomonadales bacterium]MDZ4115111.1 YceI family protein [Xanthomonadaceae bacterium]MDZ4378875.1 YceI family protein [Xanthomonadaceae bacterium]
MSKPSLHSTQRHWRCARLLLALPVLLTACQTPAPRTLDRTTPEAVAAPSDEVLRAEYASLARHGGQTYVIDAARSRLLIYAYRGGAAARLGHNHVLRATQIDGFVHVPASAAVAGARFDLSVPLQRLLIDEPELRATTGEAFAGERSAADIAGTQHNMLGPDNLDAARFPDVRVHSTAVSGDWPALVADIGITLHGVSRAMTVPLLVHRDGSELRVTGTLALRQSDFGITPYSALLGLLAVQDAVTIRFELIAREQR